MGSIGLAPVGVVVNRGRSAIEGRSAVSPLERLQAARARGRLRGLVFSGVPAAVSARGGAWADVHLPPAGAIDSDELSLLDESAMVECLVIVATSDLAFLGLRVSNGREASIASRATMLARSLDTTDCVATATAGGLALSRTITATSLEFSMHKMNATPIQWKRRGSHKMASDSAGGTQAVMRALSLLACFSGDQGELRVSELCAMTGLGQSTVSRMMSSLDRIGYVVQDERTGLYRLGQAPITMGSIALNQSPVFTAARQVAQNLAHRVGLGANVAERNGDQLFYLCNFEGPNAPKSFTMAGRTAPLNATAIGKAILSGMAREEVDAYLATGVQKFTPQTITEPAAMHAALDGIRSRGYSTEVEELAFGRACLAAPIRTRGGATVAAISVSGPLSAIDLDHPQELALQVIEAADEISVALGYSPSQRPVLAASTA
ncbi:DUF4862 family protein [Agromyces sp. NPDC058104]|uniref:DUF4862 family protein n=1 Tax=Agromyces sp. NPDC058104 TaxID=3346342 RepID=UPI0036DB77E2